jgi:hypothetical protein
VENIDCIFSEKLKRFESKLEKRMVERGEEEPDPEEVCEGIH